MRNRLALVLLAICGACGGEDAALAEIGWQFDYRDPTDTDAAAMPRDCANQPAVNPGPAYRAIDEVRVLIEDAEGQVPGSDHSHRCSLGYGGKRIEIAGLVKQNFNFALEAKAGDGTVLYRHPQNGFDEINLAVFSEQTYSLVPAVGELHFFPTFNGSLTCPGDVATVDYALFADGQSEPSVTGTANPACDAGLASELFIRDIPVTLDDPRETYNLFRLRLTGKNAGGAVTYCGTNAARVVHLGDNSIGGNENLATAATCL
jgi:hypothetical protein